MIDKTRKIALEILYKIDVDNLYSNIVLDEELNKNKQSLNEKDIGLISQIVYGTTTWKLTLDEIIKKYSKIKLKKISKWILNILRMGIYQIIFLSKIPKSAAVNESVNLAKRYGHTASSNFVNAILRKVEKEDYLEFFNIKDEKERISKAYSIPSWIIEELSKQNTIEEIEEIAKNSNLKPKISIRINKLKTTKEELIENLKQENIEVKQGLLEDFLEVEKFKNIEKNKSYLEGLFTIQDEAAGLIPILLDPKPDELILDACSSPGGKTTYIAELMQNKGEIIACDIHEHRIKLVENTAKRLGIKIIKTKLQDATIYKEEYKQKFDKILLDVPCLGIAVLKRRPDIKGTRTKQDILKISQIQKDILNVCSKYLKPGGEIVYSTCSILDEENKNIIQKFLKENKNFEIKEINTCQNEFFDKYIKKGKYIQVYQNEKTDGFFICKLKKSI